MRDAIQLKLAIEAPPRRVFEALTRAEALERWFAERAFVSPAEERYDFWGRYTPGAPDEKAGRHRLLDYEPHERLCFSWALRGEQTRVAIELAAAGDQTMLSLVQRIPKRPRTELSVADFWLLSFENLRRWLEDGTPPVRCDYQTRPRGRVELAVDIDKSREDVFRALVEPERINRWIAKDANIEPIADGRFTYGWDGEGPVKVLEIVPNEKLSHSWYHAGEPDTVTTWTLEGSGGRTRLLLVHSGFADERDTEDFRTGWLKHIVWMKSVVEKGDRWRPPELVSADWDEA